jgi:carbonic anhydrase
VIEQVANVCHTSIARDAWERGQPLAVHGWVYGIEDGLLKDLEATVTDYGEAAEVYKAALAAMR